MQSYIASIDQDMTYSEFLIIKEAVSQLYLCARYYFASSILFTCPLPKFRTHQSNSQSVSGRSAARLPSLQPGVIWKQPLQPLGSLARVAILGRREQPSRYFPPLSVLGSIWRGNNYRVCKILRSCILACRQVGSTKYESTFPTGYAQEPTKYSSPG